MANVQRIVHGKWAMVIIYFLSQGTLCFGELSKKLSDITRANLTKELRSLEEYELVNRKVYPEVPPKVEYSLADIGRKFIPVLEALEEFAIEYQHR